LNVDSSEINSEDKINLLKEIVQSLKESGVTYGIKYETLLNSLSNNKLILAAEGVPPEDGRDAVVKMYKLKEAKPEIREDGKVNHYELNLINMVSKGDWLGERIDATLGIPGKSVKGAILRATPGKSYPLQYEKSSVREEYENGVTTLYALRNGAVNYEGEKISVLDHLEIAGDVDFKTGNINFDGYVTIKGSVEDNFSIEASKDIEILGDYGVGSIREIISKEGNIFIKGGIAGKNKAVIKSKKDLYTKFVSDATIVCDGSVHIGFYCINSVITAREVILDSSKGQIIGGCINAEIKVVSSILGSPGEKRTIISVAGFDRNCLKENLEKVICEIERLKNEMIRVKLELSTYTEFSKLDNELKSEYLNNKDRFLKISSDIKDCENERKMIVNALRTKGEGEITILKRAYPGVTLEIKKITKDINSHILGTSFFFQDGDIVQA
ncbi:MAG: DUF342 domain-containing protein, partial [Clostridiaceae bacterium]|nr:DUF342 domain-containing protein [Clostridiaceae bacterium]